MSRLLPWFCQINLAPTENEATFIPSRPGRVKVNIHGGFESRSALPLAAAVSRFRECVRNPGINIAGPGLLNRGLMGRSAACNENCPGQAGVGYGGYGDSTGQGLSGPGGDHGLGQPQGSLLGAWRIPWRYRFAWRFLTKQSSGAVVRIFSTPIKEGDANRESLPGCSIILGPLCGCHPTRPPAPCTSGVLRG